MSIAYLGDVAQALLDAGTAALATATTGRPLPKHRYITHARPALSGCCDGVLTVHLGEITHGERYVTDQPQSCAVLHEPTFVITVARCWPTPEAGAVPSDDALDDAAVVLLEDLWALLTELADRIGACSLFSGMAACKDASIVDVMPLEAEGGCAGWEIRVRLTTNDAGPVGS